MTAAEALRRLVAALERGGELPADLAEWLTRGARAVLLGDARSLDCALGLRARRGRWSEAAHLADRFRRRDALLVALAAHAPGRGAWARCEGLAAMLEGELAPDGPRAAAVLEALLKVEGELPARSRIRSVRQLHRVLSGNRSAA